MSLSSYSDVACHPSRPCARRTSRGWVTLLAWACTVSLLPFSYYVGRARAAR
jgi:hypothetical protein